MAKTFTDVLQQAKIQHIIQKQKLDINDIQTLKDTRQKLFNERSEIMEEKKKIREEFHLPVLGFSKTEQGQRFEAQYGARLQEINKAIEELSMPIQEFENKERETKRKQNETLEEKQARKNALIDERMGILREEKKLTGELKQIRAEWVPVMDKLTDELKAEGRSLDDLFETKEYKDYRDKKRAVEDKIKVFKETNQERLEKLNLEIDLVKSEIEALQNNEEYVKYHNDLRESSLNEVDFRRKQIVEAYGLTTNPHTAGYIFPDGTMLQMGEKGFRGEDHRLVREFFEPGSKEFINAEASMWAFIAEGNIRWMPEGPGISINAKNPLTREQKMALYDIVDYAKSKSDSFYMDVVNGDKIKSFKYEGKQMSVARIAKDFNDCRIEMAQTNQEPKQTIHPVNKPSALEEMIREAKAMKTQMVAEQKDNQKPKTHNKSNGER